MDKEEGEIHLINGSFEPLHCRPSAIPIVQSNSHTEILFHSNQPAIDFYPECK